VGNSHQVENSSPHWWEMAKLPSGNDLSDKRTTSSKFNTSHPKVDLLYKSQLFTDCFTTNIRQTVLITKTTNI